MIAKIRRGQKLGGLMVYLLGSGDHNEHKDRHIIAGSPTVMRAAWLEHFEGESAEVKAAAREAALAVAHEIEIPRTLYGTQVRMKAKPVAVGVGGRELGMDVVEPAGKGEKSVMRNAPVWHCVLALQPGEELDDAKWSQVVNEFMSRMGFTGTKDGKVAQARWAAVRHGHSGETGEGQDHIHIAASLIREDGSKVSTFDYGPGRARGDWNRADEVCGELEREFGLQVLASRKEGGGLSGNSRAEIERSKRLGTPETERERLRRLVRAYAGAAESETEFVTGLRGAGISIRPRYAAGGTDEVTGYSVRFRRDGAEVGPWVGGGKLAGDLSLAALREQQWDDSPAGRADALAAWKGRTTTSGRAARAGGDGVEAWQQAAAEAGQWRDRLAEVPHGDRAQWAWLAGQAAGVFAAWSEHLEGDQPGAFAAAADSLTRSAQMPRRTDRYRPPPGTHPTALGDVARLLLDQPARSKPQGRGSGRVRDDDIAAQVAIVLVALMFVLLAIAIAIALAVARAHRARGELGRALAVEHMTREHLDPVRAQWESDLEARRAQWDRDAAAVFTSAAERAAKRAAGHTSAPESEDANRGSQDQTDRAKKLAAAQGPLTPPTQPGAEVKPRRRAYYTELSADQRSTLRAAAVASSGFVSDDIAPARWSDDWLDTELQHLRTEVALLVADIADRNEHGGPHTRQVSADNAELTQKAAKIPAAQQAQRAADEISTKEHDLTTTHTRLQQELDALSGRRMLARKKKQAEVDKVAGERQDLAPEAARVRKAAEIAAKATGAPASEWDAILFEAQEQRQKRRLSSARHQDAQDLGDDTTYLQHLQRNLEKVETEHARREQLTPEQRAAEVRTQSKARTTGPKRSVGTERPADPRRPFRGPDRGPSAGQGIGM
ncbi:relaxase/mobilization nuclease domain-containing protein (plasmid) [Nocardia sp. CA-084685]|uniref:relaxase/mobilization nuclease domain-containing protein n=1 Tax=Nocardia sp. CA-084685 TaxID=3239970 RepID=UPI003D977547